ncbi:hypothetical protein MTO96_051978 [Rhipicephalus appendiculatus]
MGVRTINAIVVVNWPVRIGVHKESLARFFNGPHGGGVVDQSDNQGSRVSVRPLRYWAGQARAVSVASGHPRLKPGADPALDHSGSDYLFEGASLFEVLEVLGRTEGK